MQSSFFSLARPFSFFISRVLRQTGCLHTFWNKCWPFFLNDACLLLRTVSVHSALAFTICSTSMYIIAHTKTEVQVLSEVKCPFYCKDGFGSLSVYSRHLSAFPGQDQVWNVRNCVPEAQSKVSDRGIKSTLA